MATRRSDFTVAMKKSKYKYSCPKKEGSAWQKRRKRNGLRERFLDQGR